LTFTEWLKQEFACTDGIEYVGGRTLREAWEQCEIGMWLLWLLGRLGFGDKRIWRLIGCACVRDVWGLLDPLSKAAVETAERYAVGTATDAELAAARRDAEAACKAASGGCYKAAAWSAAWSAFLSGSGGSRAAMAAEAAEVAVVAAAVAAVATGIVVCDTAADAVRAYQAEHVRELVPWEAVVALALQAGIDPSVLEQELAAEKRLSAARLAALQLTRQ